MTAVPLGLIQTFPSNMAYAYTFIVGVLIGILGGILVYRNNAAKIKATEDKGKNLLDALKGR